MEKVIYGQATVQLSYESTNTTANISVLTKRLIQSNEKVLGSTTVLATNWM